MSDAGHEAAESGELLGLDEALLRVAQVGKRLLGPLLGGPQLVLGLLLGDGVVAEHLDGARHLARLVARPQARHLEVVVAATTISCIATISSRSGPLMLRVTPTPMTTTAKTNRNATTPTLR